MSALEVLAVPTATPARSLHVVHEGEVSARMMRIAHRAQVAHVRAQARARVVAGFATIVGLLGAAWVTMAYAFLAVPNTPIP